MAQESWSTAELERVVSLAAADLEAAPVEARRAVLSELVFKRLGFVREVDDTDLRFVMLPSVLRERRGSCVGLGTLLLAMAEALHLSANGVLMPGHFYVRLPESAGHRNVELLRRGEAMSDAWYRARFPIEGGDAPEYARPLAPNEALGVIEYNLGNERRRQLRIDEARAAYLRSVRLFPGFAEAHASLGACLQLVGELDEAVNSYRRARVHNPHLPGIEQNLALLDQEQRARSR